MARNSSIHIELLALCLSTILRHRVPNSDDFHLLLNLYESETDQKVKLAILRALAHTNDPALLDHVFECLANVTREWIRIVLEEFNMSVIPFIQQRKWDWFIDTGYSGVFGSVISGMTGRFYLEKVQKWVLKNNQISKAGKDLDYLKLRTLLMERHIESAAITPFE